MHRNETRNLPPRSSRHHTAKAGLNWTWSSDSNHSSVSTSNLKNGWGDFARLFPFNQRKVIEDNDILEWQKLEAHVIVPTEIPWKNSLVAETTLRPAFSQSGTHRSLWQSGKGLTGSKSVFHFAESVCWSVKCGSDVKSNGFCEYFAIISHNSMSVNTGQPQNKIENNQKKSENGDSVEHQCFFGGLIESTNE